jgi:gamma-glutamyltranspeptidase / glutathione hydrolase
MRERAVVTSHPLATDVGYEVLDAGGTAVDAAVAAAAMLTVVDPRSTGVGGDLFATIWESGAREPIGLNAAGCAPAGLTIDALLAQGFTHMPQVGPWSVTVPGAVGGWQALLDRFGVCDLATVLGPSQRAAANGSTVTPVVAKEWQANEQKVARDDAAAAIFLRDGRAPTHGELWRNPAYADLLQHLIDEGLSAFYRGDVATSIAEAVQGRGGPLAVTDLNDWDGVEWVTPRAIDFGDYRVHELPPPGQGLVALIALGIYAARPGKDPVDAIHVAIEAVKAGFEDASTYVADPRFEDVPLDELLAPDRLLELRERMDQQPPGQIHIGPPTDTVYLAVADEHGGACSLIQSVYDGFGSAVGVEDLGIVLQNRGGCFDLIAGHPNAPAPGKRPYHTIIPAMLSKDGGFAGCLGVVGGFMQPQGHLQVLRNLIELGMDPQEAVDAPRFRVLSRGRVEFEEGYDRATIEALEARGHETGELDEFLAGGAQLLLRGPGGLLVGSDRRKDGYAH